MALSFNNVKEIVNSYQLLFGTYTSFSTGILKNLYTQKVKTAYRRKVKRIHPDKSTQLGIQEPVLTEQFTEITKAYETLLSFIEHKNEYNEFKPMQKFSETSSEVYSSSPKNMFAIDPGPPPAKPIEPSRIPGDFYYRGWIPHIPLRFGRFLYYRSLISWNMLVDSIYWQKINRPSIGQLCVQKRFLSSKDVAHILYYQKYGDSFGQVAKSLGKLTEEQIQELIRKQTRYKSKLGRFFLDKNVFSKNQLNQFLQELNDHNSKFQCSDLQFSLAQ